MLLEKVLHLLSEPQHPAEQRITLYPLNLLVTGQGGENGEPRTHERTQ